MKHVYCSYRDDGSDVVVNRYHFTRICDSGSHDLTEWNVYVAAFRMGDGERVRLDHPVAGTQVVLQSPKRAVTFLEWLKEQGFGVPDKVFFDLRCEIQEPGHA